MSSRLPIEVENLPLVSSVVEIRFNSKIKAEDTLSSFYPALIQKYPNLKDAKDKLSNNRYRFSNDNYAVTVTSNSILIGNVGYYKLWKNYFEVVKDILLIVKKLDVVMSLTRVGLRYSNVFSDKKFIGEVINTDTTIKYNDYALKQQFVISQFIKENITLHLQVAQDADITRQVDNKTFKGVYIDIDASSKSNLPSNIDDSLNDLIDLLHGEEKKLFYHLLKEDVIKSLNPKY